MFIQISGQNKSTDESINDIDKLWKGIREGRSESLSGLFCISYSWLFNYGFKIVPKEDFIKDTIQELFLNVWKRRDGINKAISVKSYLFSSLRRIIMRRLQKQRNRTQRNHSYDENHFKEIYNIEEVIIHFETSKEKKEQLKLAMESLSERQKEAIYLKFYNGLSNNEIAEVMGINKQSVYNHVSKAIAEMQDYVT